MLCRIKPEDSMSCINCSIFLKMWVTVWAYIRDDFVSDWSNGRQLLRISEKKTILEQNKLNRCRCQGKSDEDGEFREPFQLNFMVNDA